jgi:pimeloyl-ACP methyl ester carboxylesterase
LGGRHNTTGRARHAAPLQTHEAAGGSKTRPTNTSYLPWQNGETNLKIACNTDDKLNRRGYNSVNGSGGITMDKRFFQRRSFWIKTGIVTAFIAVAAYFGAGYMVYDKLSTIGAPSVEDAANNPSSFRVTDSRWSDFDTKPYFVASYQDVSFPSRGESINLSGWYMESSPGAPVVIVVHGINSNKHDAKLLTPAGMLVRNGFNVLMFDLRNHGDSGKDNGRTSMGNKEYLDVLGAWDYLIEKKGYEPDRIGIYAVSLGAGTSLTAFAQEPGIAALFVDSPFANLQEIAKAELALNNYPTFLWYSAYLTARVTGVDLLEHNPYEAIPKCGGRPLYIVHGTADVRISVEQTYELRDMARATGTDVTVWITEGVEYVGSQFELPVEYESRLVGFFTESLK